MKIKKIINQPVSSNCFIVLNEENGSCIVIDPGSEDSSVIEQSIEGKNVDFIFLTHEHFDHIWCADKIRKKYNAKLCCSFDTAGAITNRKKNMSVFFNQVGFELNPCDIILIDEQFINWKGIQIEIIYTPGHTNGCICIKINNNLFTGDTVIKGVTTVTKLPGGDKDKLKNSMDKLMQKELYMLNLYCGHGENEIKG
jgi:glyoxylase-like metal-dependent hydrolase (beta-lactamase superfamily II)